MPEPASWDEEEEEEEEEADGEREREREGWRESVVSISLAGPAHWRDLITCMTKVSEAATQHSADCRGVTDHTADNYRGSSDLEQLIAPVPRRCLDKWEAPRDEMSNATGLSTDKASCPSDILRRCFWGSTEHFLVARICQKVPVLDARCKLSVRLWKDCGMANRIFKYCRVMQLKHLVTSPSGCFPQSRTATQVFFNHSSSISSCARWKTKYYCLVQGEIR